MHRFNRANPGFGRFLIFLLFVGMCGRLASAQAVRKSTARAANVQSGTLTSIDAAAGTVILKPKTGADITYHLTDKTHVLKDKKSVEPTAFKAGDAVVVRFRKSSAGPASLYDLADKPSWDWLSRLRKETTEITLVEVGDDSIRGTEGADKSDVEYRVTDKTAWQKNNKAAVCTDFKPGERVFVVPRLLPGGNLMATGVSDVAAGAAILKEHAKTTLSGSLKAINVEKRTLSVRTAAGEDRDLAIASDCVVRAASKDVPISYLHPGLLISIHLARGAENELAASRITVQSKKTTRRPASKATKVIPKPVVKP